MNKIIFGILFLIFYTVSSATIFCEDLDDYAYLDVDLESLINAVKENHKIEFLNQCIKLSGSENTFSYTGEWVKTCNGKTGSKKGYIKSIIGCNFCEGTIIKNQLILEESLCNASCRDKNTTCRLDSDGWGGEIVKINPNIGDCGAYNASLPGCNESSSSIALSSSSLNESSSSIQESSSSTESSSSYTETSSSSNEDNSSSSNENDEETNESSSSENSCGNAGNHCVESGGSGTATSNTSCLFGDDYKNELSNLESVHLEIYSNSSYLKNIDKVYVSNCHCMKSRFVACDFENFGLTQGYEPIEMNLCGYKEGYWCNNQSLGYCDYTGQMTRLYYTDENNVYNTQWWAETFDGRGNLMPIENASLSVILTSNYGEASSKSELFSMRHVLPSNVSKQDLDNWVLQTFPNIPLMNNLVEYCHGEWIPHDEDCFGTQLEVQQALQETSNECKLHIGIPHYEIELSERGWCIIGNCEDANILSSSSIKSSSSLQTSSSSEPIIISSSSISEITETFIMDGNQDYTPDQIFNRGLANMDDGKCYSINPERGVQHGWINNNAQDSWWWTEVPCDGSSIYVETTSAGCIQHNSKNNSIYLPSDCFYSGLDNMEEGKCYTLNPDRGIWYSWINTNAQDSWWWQETPCEIDETESDMACPNNNFILSKKTSYSSNSYNNSNLSDEPIKSYNYDALGRKLRETKLRNNIYPTYKKIISQENNTLHYQNNGIKFKALFKISSGNVEAETILGFENIMYECSTKGISIKLGLYIKTPNEKIKVNLDSENQDLLHHENMHKEIFQKFGNGYWEKELVINKNIKTSQICNVVKNSFWPFVENKYRNLLNKQNQWDDEDSNNISHERIDVNTAIAQQKVIWFAQQCH